MSILKSLEKQRQILQNAENQANEADTSSKTFSQESGITYEFNKPLHFQTERIRYGTFCLLNSLKIGCEMNLIFLIVNTLKSYLNEDNMYILYFC